LITSNHGSSYVNLEACGEPGGCVLAAP